MKKALLIGIILTTLILTLGVIIFYNNNKPGNKSSDSSWKELDNPSKCENIVNQEEKDWCMWNVAINTSDGNICLKISSERTYQIETFLLRDFCYETIAFNTGEISWCSKISLDASPPPTATPEHFRETCEDNARLKIVRDTNDTSECEFIHDAYWKERCFEKIGE